jgi:hypothetical protein
MRQDPGGVAATTSFKTTSLATVLQTGPEENGADEGI